MVHPRPAASAAAGPIERRRDERGSPCIAPTIFVAPRKWSGELPSSTQSSVAHFAGTHNPENPDEVGPHRRLARPVRIPRSHRTGCRVLARARVAGPTRLHRVEELRHRRGARPGRLCQRGARSGRPFCCRQQNGRPGLGRATAHRGRGPHPIRRLPGRPERRPQEGSRRVRPDLLRGAGAQAGADRGAARVRSPGGRQPSAPRRRQQQGEDQLPAREVHEAPRVRSVASPPAAFAAFAASRSTSGSW